MRDLSQGKRFNLSQLAIGAALAGEGIAIGRVATMIDELDSGRLVPLLPVAVRSSASYNFISGHDRPARISAVHRWLLEESKVFQERRDRLLSNFSVVEA